MYICHIFLSFSCLVRTCFPFFFLWIHLLSLLMADCLICEISIPSFFPFSLCFVPFSLSLSLIWSLFLATIFKCRQFLHIHLLNCWILGILSLISFFLIFAKSPLFSSLLCSGLISFLLHFCNNFGAAGYDCCLLFQVIFYAHVFRVLCDSLFSCTSMFC